MHQVLEEVTQIPDARPLPEGWCQIYEPLSKKWYYLNNNVDPVTVFLLHPAAIEPEVKKDEPLTKPVSVARALPLPPVSQRADPASDRKLYRSSTRFSVIDPTTIDLECLTDSPTPQDPLSTKSSLPACRPYTTLPQMQHVGHRMSYSETPTSTPMSLYSCAIVGQPILHRSNAMRSTHTAPINTAAQTHHRSESYTTDRVPGIRIQNSALTRTSTSPGQPTPYLTTTTRPPNTEQIAMQVSSDGTNSSQSFSAGNTLSTGPIPSIVTFPASSTTTVFPHPSMPSIPFPQYYLPYVSGSNMQLPSAADTTAAAPSKKSRKEMRMQAAKIVAEIAARTTLHVAGGFISGATGIPSSVITSLEGLLFNKKLIAMFKAAFSKKSVKNVTESDLQAVMQGRPDANYQVVIDALILQQRLAQAQVDDGRQIQSLNQSIDIDYSSLIAEIERLQKVAEVHRQLALQQLNSLNSQQETLAHIRTQVIQQRQAQALLHSCQPQPNYIPTQQLSTTSQLQPQRNGATEQQILPQVQSILQQQQCQINTLFQRQALANQQQQEQQATFQKFLQEQNRQLAIRTQIGDQLQQQATSNLKIFQSTNRPQSMQDGQYVLTSDEIMRQRLQQQQALYQIPQNRDANQVQQDVPNVQVAINQNFQNVAQDNFNLQNSDQCFRNLADFSQENLDTRTWNTFIQNTTQASQQQPSLASLAGMSNSSLSSEMIGVTPQAPNFGPRDTYPDIANDLNSAGLNDFLDNFSDLSLVGGTTLG